MTTRRVHSSVLLAMIFFGSAAGAAEIGAEVVFSDGEITAIRAYYDSADANTATRNGMGMGGGRYHATM